MDEPLDSEQRRSAGRTLVQRPQTVAHHRACVLFCCGHGGDSTGCQVKDYDL